MNGKAAAPRRVSIVEAAPDEVGHAFKRGARDASDVPRRRAKAIANAMLRKDDCGDGGQSELRADERLDDSDDDLGSPLPALPSFSAKVLRDNESVANFMAWCARGDTAEPDPRAGQADAFTKWCASASTKRADRLNWVAAFTSAPSFLKRRQLEALALSLTKPQLRQLAIANATARNLVVPAIDVTNLPAAVPLPSMRARRTYTRAGHRGRSTSPFRLARDGSLSNCSSESRTQRRLILTHAGTGAAAAFASVGSPPAKGEDDEDGSERPPPPSSPSCSGSPEPLGEEEEEETEHRSALPLQLHAPRRPQQLATATAGACSRPESPRSRRKTWLEAAEEDLLCDEYSTAPPEADDFPPPPAPLRRSLRVPRLRP